MVDTALIDALPAEASVAEMALCFDLPVYLIRYVINTVPVQPCRVTGKGGKQYFDRTAQRDIAQYLEKHQSRPATLRAKADLARLRADLERLKTGQPSPPDDALRAEVDELQAALVDVSRTVVEINALCVQTAQDLPKVDRVIDDLAGKVQALETWRDRVNRAALQPMDQQLVWLTAQVADLRTWQQQVTAGLEEIDTVLGAVGAKQDAMLARLEVIDRSYGNFLVTVEARLRELESHAPDTADDAVREMRQQGAAFLEAMEERVMQRELDRLTHEEE